MGQIKNETRINDYITISNFSNTKWINTNGLKNDFGLNEEEIKLLIALTYYPKHELLPIKGYNKITNKNAVTFANPMSVALFDYIRGIQVELSKEIPIFLPGSIDRYYYLERLEVAKSIFIKTDPITFKLCYCTDLN